MIKALIVSITMSLASLSHANVNDPRWVEIHGNGIYTVAQEYEASGRAEEIARDFEHGRLEAIAEKTDRSLGAIIEVAYRNLKRKGHAQTASKLRTEWKQHQGEIVRIVRNPSRDIGSFKPLSDWLARAYETIEAKLGYEICRALRLSDLKTLNYAIPVVFAPCKHGQNEFTMHFCHDAKYRGLAPVVTYWTVSITCSMATFGLGIFFVCSPIAMLTELVMDRKIAPWLAPKIYNAACGSEAVILPEYIPLFNSAPAFSSDYYSTGD